MVQCKKDSALREIVTKIHHVRKHLVFIQKRKLLNQICIPYFVYCSSIEKPSVCVPDIVSCCDQFGSPFIEHDPGPTIVHVKAIWNVLVVAHLKPFVTVLLLKWKTKDSYTVLFCHCQNLSWEFSAHNCNTWPFYCFHFVEKNVFAISGCQNRTCHDDCVMWLQRRMASRVNIPPDVAQTVKTCFWTQDANFLDCCVLCSVTPPGTWLD